MSIVSWDPKPGFSLTLKGGERKAERDQAIKSSLEAMTDNGIKLPILVKDVSWYKRKQRRASSVRWIATGTDIEGVTWVVRIVQGTEKGEPFCEIRSLHPLEVPCKQAQVETSDVPLEVVDTLKGALNEASGLSRRLAVLRQGQLSNS